MASTFYRDMLGPPGNYSQNVAQQRQMELERQRASRQAQYEGINHYPLGPVWPQDEPEEEKPNKKLLLLEEL